VLTARYSDTASQDENTKSMESRWTNLSGGAFINERPATGSPF
jgi:hypothetical protein